MGVENMGRLFSCILLLMMLLPGIKGMDDAQPVFFSMLFPQLIPAWMIDAKVVQL